MRHLALAVALLAAPGLAGSSVRTAGSSTQPHHPAEDFSLQKGPPDCNRWTDECVTCTRDVDGEAPVCSNIGLACQPRAIRCTASEARK